MGLESVNLWLIVIFWVVLESTAVHKTGHALSLDHDWLPANKLNFVPTSNTRRHDVASYTRFKEISFGMTFFFRIRKPF